MWGVSGRKQLNSDILGFSAAGYPQHRENRENGKKSPCQGRHREFGYFIKTLTTQGIWLAHVVNSLILKVYFDICSENFQISFLKLDKSAKSVLCML